jgi:methyl-accepting chemotaxis protein
MDPPHPAAAGTDLAGVRLGGMGLPVLAAAGTSTVAVGVTVVATLVVVALLLAVLALVRAARDLRRAATSLRDQAAELLSELDDAVARSEHQLQRVDDLVGSAESISEAVGSASRLASTAVAGPVIKAMAFGAGAARAGRRLREGAPPPQLSSRALGSGRRRQRR